MLTVRVPDEAGTRAVAARIARLSRPGDLIVVAGEMGAGKTRFAQGFGAALGITEPITSPTFTLVHSYPIDDRRTLHHADLYRLEQLDDVEQLALHELAEFGGIVLIEWGDVAASRLGEHLEVRLELDDDEPSATPMSNFGLDAGRWVTLSAVGQGWAGRWSQLADALDAPHAEGGPSC